MTTNGSTNTTNTNSDNETNQESKTGLSSDHSTLGSVGWDGTNWKEYNPQKLGFTSDTTLEVELQNIGGVSHETIEFTPGVSLLVGENATNRTSILEGIGAALGGNTGSLRAGTDTGSVVLSTPKTTFTTEFSRRGSTVTRSHDGPWATDQQSIAAVTNFVILNEANPIRQTIRTGADSKRLYELIMEPVDTEGVETAIADVQSERTRIERHIEELEDKQQQLPTLEEQRNNVKSEIDRLETEVEEVQAEIDHYELDRQEAEQQTEQMDEYEALLSKKERLERDLETQRNIRETAKEKLAEKEAELESFSVDELSDYEDIEALENAIEELREKKDTTQRTADKIRTLVRTTQEMLEAEASLMNEFENSDEIAADLDPGSKQITCWTCGGVVERKAIENRVDELKSLSQEKQQEIQQLESKQKKLRQQRDTYQKQQRERQQLQADIDDLEREIETANADIERIQDELKSVETEIDSLEQELEASDTTDEIDTLLDAYQRRGSLQNELENKRDSLDEIESEIASIEADITELEELRDQKDEIDSELEELRNAIERIEQAVENEFNERMDAFLDSLGYDENIARIWLERKVTNGETVFDLHVVRTSEDGTVQEDDILHLSESERELVGFVIAIAGYAAHNIDELVPILILDSLEAIDAPRLEKFLSDLIDTTDLTHLAAALLNEDAAVLPDSYSYIHPTAAEA